LAVIQDFYLPEVRGNRRMGEWRDYHGRLELSGAWFVRTLTCVVSNIQKFREEAILSGRLNAASALLSSGITPHTLSEWQFHIHFDATSIDPLDNWRDLVAAGSYHARTRLKYDALLAVDFYETVEVLRLFSVDAGLSKPAPEFTDPTDCSPRDEATGLPSWKIEKYGETFFKPFAQLEFVANDYDLNPRPRAIVFTEGDEWQAIAALYIHYNFEPDLLGIEFRSIGGSGNFSLANWQPFIEYMHEKQVLVFFIIDNEGYTAREARRLLERKRQFQCAGLQKVIPADDRIRVWQASFEEDNFSDEEIAGALASLGLTVSSSAVAAERASAGEPGLIRRIFKREGKSVSKPQLDMLLVNNLIEQRRAAVDSSDRPIDIFVRASGKLIVFNYQPTSIDLVRINRESGYLG
jgi:hypothetical protein